jgi:hypothetical protein
MSKSSVNSLLNQEFAWSDETLSLDENTFTAEISVLPSESTSQQISTLTESSTTLSINSDPDFSLSSSNIPIALSAGAITFGASESIASFRDQPTFSLEQLENSQEHDEKDYVDAYPVSDEHTLVEGIITNNASPSTPISISNFDLSKVFKLHSNPNAKHTIYLDFDGHVTQNTFWNDATHPTIISPAYDTDGNAAVFSTTELQTIVGIWQRVTEDYAPFEVDVTTEAPNIEDLRNSGPSDTRWGIRALMTQNVNTVDNTPVYSGAGGVAYVGSFNYNSDTPLFAFNKGENNAAMTASHEVGHSLGLDHDGQLDSNPNDTVNDAKGYSDGFGTGDTSWGPLMGAPFGKSLTQWSKGEYQYANNREDDLAIITTNNGFGYRVDDYGNSINASTRLYADASNNISTFGLIERNTDTDVFSFLTGTGNVSLNIAAASRDYISDGNGNYSLQYLDARGSNLDLWAGIYSADGTLVAQSNPVDLLSTNFTNLFLNAGLYYLQIDGVGKSGTNGYTDYGSLGQYAISGVLTSANTTPVHNDFNGDNKSDILWRNDNGDMYLWQMDGTAIPSYGYIARGVTSDWKVAGTDDFNGDNKSDILWRNDNGDMYLWQMDGTAIPSYGYIARGVTSDWKVAGTDDFNGDNKSDILWRNDNGDIYLWQMDGTSIPSYGYIARGVTSDWKVAGTDDFNGDNKSDILWRNDNGDMYLWQMDGTAIPSYGYIARGVTSDWKVAGTDDFNGDNKSDILWRNDNGDMYLWQMDGTSISSYGYIAKGVTLDWNVAGIGDFNGDNKSDILWRNDNGTDSIWFMNGSTISSSGYIASADTSWNIV